MAGRPILLGPGGALLPVGGPGGSYAQVVQSLDKLRWYYRFEEDSEGPFEPTVGPGALEVKVTFWYDDPVSKVPSANGQLGEAITTAGEGSRVGLPDGTVIPDLPSGNSMSIGLWAKIPAGGSVTVLEGATNHAGAYVDEWYMVVGDGGDGWNTGIMYGYSEDPERPVWEGVSFQIDPNSDTWAFYGCVFGLESWSFYLNGEKFGEHAVNEAVHAIERLNDLYIYLDNGAAVDEVFATSTALTDQQWADLYAAATAN